MPVSPPSPPRSSNGREAIEVAGACAAAAGAVIRDGYRRTTVSSVKAHRSVVTEVDLAAEAAVLGILAAEYPGMPVLAEETAATAPAGGWLWVVDPVDGTRNYARGIPHFAFSIALCFDGEPVLGLTSHPVLGQDIAAVRGRGTTLNGQPVGAAATEHLADAVIALDLGYDDEAGAAQLRLATSLWTGVQGLRVSGSAALGLAFVATGYWDAFVHRGLEPWDLAAGIVLVREAGGVVSTLDGAPPALGDRALLAAAPGVHAAMVAAIARAAEGR